MTDKLVQPAPHPAISVPMPALMRIQVHDLLQNESQLRVGEYRIEARVSGLYAHVTTEWTIHNDNTRILEGELEFPLPDGGVVCGYAIDLDGVMTPASVVEKEKARIAFEAEVKLGVDPGIVEHVRGNAYRTRIYPILAKGSRRIRVEYIAPLVLGDDGGAALYLPVPRTPLKRRDVLITVDMPDMPAPTLSGLGSQMFAQARAAWVVETHDTDITPDDDLRVAMPLLPEVLTAIAASHDDTFFAISVRTPQKQAPAGDALPKNWRILWDASGSRGEAEIGAALDMLRALPEGAHYRLHVFRNEAEEAMECQNLAALLDELAYVDYDGGTDYAALQAIADEPFDGVTLFFTDGFDTFSGAVPEFGPASAAIVSSKMRDLAVLRHICGGRVFDLATLTPKQILEHLANTPQMIGAAKSKGISDVLGIGVPTPGRLSILGRLTRDTADVELSFSDGRTMPVRLTRSSATDAKTIALAWAARRVEELSPAAENNREELLALGRHFSIVSPVSSMIVFERLDQWLKYDIEPPKALAEYHQAWLQNRHKAKTDAMRTQSDWDAALQAEWQQRLDWWQNPVPKIQKPRSGVFAQDAGERMRGGAVPPQMMGGAVPQMMGGAVPPQMPGGAVSSQMMGGAVPQVHMMRSAMRNRETDAVAGSPVIMEDACVPCCEEACVCEDAGHAENTPHEAEASSAKTITIQPWNADMPYVHAIEDSVKIFKDNDRMYKEYLKQRKAYALSPSFYLDCAGVFFKHHQNKYAIRILSNLSELKLDDPALLRVYAWRLREAGELDRALVILKKVAKLRPDEAVSFRDLALTYTLRAKERHSAEDVEAALSHYKHAIETPCPRKDAVYTAVVAIEEFNALAAWSGRQQWPDHAPDMPEINAEYRQNLDTDIRIVLMWDADSTDIDLHVLEPSGEEVFYGNKRSVSGGMISHDVTTGYGPEEYLHKKALAGTYKIVSNYFASHQQKLTGPVTVTATVFTDWGRPNEKSRTLSLRLEKAKDRVMIGEMTMG